MRFGRAKPNSRLHTELYTGESAEMAKSDPTKDPEFKRVLDNLLSAKPKPHSKMKLGKAKRKKKKNVKAKKPTGE